MSGGFQILGEEPEFLAVDKPPGLLVHPTKPGGPHTLLDGLGELLCYERTTGGSIGIINRLDRETSGVVLVAKSAAAARELSLAMHRRAVRKEYLALCHGWPEADNFAMDAPILRLGEVGPFKVWLKRGIHPRGSPARTRFRVERRLNWPGRGPIALIRAFPSTGRTHQIRVHLAEAGYPVVGDKLYSRGEESYLEFIRTGWSPALEETLWLPRHALHSAKIEFPFGGVWHAFESALAPDLQQVLRRAQEISRSKNVADAETSE